MFLPTLKSCKQSWLIHSTKSQMVASEAKVMHHLAVIRSVNTAEGDHGKGAYMMLTGRRQTPAADYPQIGAVAARALADEASGLPGHIRITPGGGGGRGF